MADDSVDVVISNCVIKLSATSPESSARRPASCDGGGRFAVTDIVADVDMDEATRQEVQQWTGCVAGTLTQDKFRGQLGDACFDEIDVLETHRVH